ncbi:homeobox-leucine zipper protein ATHB-15-like [Actinidia eriantha]|uniref:homeobox-leucine zipper protein ATHB-15-like n=1 Tax=Actinidia eriantha TaxID=165200 RepID=UPI00258B455E|nr:homeobox-leucine zipper protein ATHB-15-like [Actinidia eriantha]
MGAKFNFTKVGQEEVLFQFFPNAQEGMMAVTSACKEGKMGMDNGKYVRYTPEQVQALERVYHECPKPSSLRPQQLIHECPILCNIEPKQIKVWVQNRRYFMEF